MSRSLRVCVLAAVIVQLAACGGSSPPAAQAASSTEDAGATQLRDTIQRPINRAKAVEGIIMKAHDHQDQQLQSEENGDAGASSPDASTP